MNNVTQAIGQVVTTMLTRPTSSTSGYYICWFKADSAEQYMFIYSMMCYVNPAVSIFGFTANMMSLAILQRNGLHKPSNILLFSLVIADSMCLMTTLNYGQIILFFGPNKPFPIYCGFQYEDSVGYFLAISSAIFNTIGWWGHYTSTILPFLITLERILAIFRPLTFKAVVTTAKTGIAVICPFILCLIYTLTENSYFEISKIRLTKTVNWIALVDNIPKFFEPVEIYFFDGFLSWFSVAFITFGCLTIWIKVKNTLKQRRNLTSSRNKLTWSPRTTRTLILTCLIFSLTRGACSLFFTLYVCYNETQMHARNQLGLFLYAINASNSLFVYILSNRKLCQNFKSIMHISKTK
nr:putative G-protein coupled receptor [Biomphalaria glabrata]